ncbi:MAG TPA: PAS domain-containing protein [Rhizomicrobium sp.]|jgi:hypothetical protein
MRLYRLYLKSWSNHTIGRADYDADDEAIALAIAAGIFDACSDIAAGMEVWKGPEMIFSSKQSALPGKSADLTGHQKRLITSTEIKLRDSGWQISKSRKLIEAIEMVGGSSTPGTSQSDERLDEALGDAKYPREAAKPAGPANDLDNFIAGIESPALRAVAEHWSDVRGRKLMPAWNDISSSVLAPHFKLLWAFTFDRRRGEFVGRLAGRQVKEWFGTNFSGHKLDDMHPPHVVTEAHALLTKVVTIPAAGRSSGRLATVGGHTVTGERIALPLATDGTNADGVLGASVYIDPPAPQAFELIHENIVWCPISRIGELAEN